MKRAFVYSICLFLCYSVTFGQQPAKKVAPDPAKKYTSLLWEITGNGMKKPSYLFGTMHISDKLVFHLGDSFYNAIRSVDVVALESNPDNWQDNYSESVFFRNRNNNYIGELMRYAGSNMNNRWLISSFAIDNNTEAIKAALAVEPSLVNGLLYRTYGNRMADFEEDTYLDMHIFQTGKKLGKRLTGVENFKESEKLVMEAYRDMFKDRQKKKSYDFEGMYTNPKRMEEAYRKGDLDALDSLDALEVTSDAFQEKFLYKRNEIQARSIDSIIKRSSLFVGVGAAHLPGKRGVIDMLRKMGYTLRPVKMDDRNSAQKDAIDKMRFANNFTPVTSQDGFYTVSIPGKKFYSFTDWDGLEVKQLADMANGSYYMVMRVKTNSRFLGNTEEQMLKKVDSLLYENIPGKILKKTAITRNGYKGWEILNRIRRGDNQRYNIYVTPFEILIFKMSGNGDYISKGPEANQFFGSVVLKEYKETQWVNFKPATGGFAVQMPYQPSLLADKNTGTNRIEYAAHDAQNSYLVMQANPQSYEWAEEDSFELKLVEESYAYSNFIDKKTSQQFLQVNGYPALEAKYKLKDGGFSHARFIIRGPVCYIAAVRGKAANENAGKFLQSFTIQPFIYPETKERADTALHFTVRSPFFPEEKKEDELEKLVQLMNFSRFSDEEDDNMAEAFFGKQRVKIIGNDTLGEKIVVSWEKPGPYAFIRDSVAYMKGNFTETSEENSFSNEEDSTFIIKLDKLYDLPGGVKCHEQQLTDTGSSRLILKKYFYKNGHVFSLHAVTDTLNQSPFITGFFSSFMPADTLKGESLFTRKTEKFFNDYFSNDSAMVKKARNNLSDISFDKEDAPLLKTAIERVNRKTRDYSEVKKQFIGELGALKDSTVVPFLKALYWKVKDTADFQNAVLDALLANRTKESFIAFKDLVLQETPVKGNNNFGFDMNRSFRILMNTMRRYQSGSRSSVIYPYLGNIGGSWFPLNDTLDLTRVIFPDILQLLNVEDYKEDVTNLLIRMVDSGRLKAADYEAWFTKINIDAKQLLKKQFSGEDEVNIEKENRLNRPRTYLDDDDEDDKEMESGNNDLVNHAVLMMPFYDTKPGVPAFFDQLLRTRDRQLFYDACILLLRNKRPVPDSFYTRYAKLDEYRSRLYGDLENIKQTDKIPAAYKTQELIARSLLLERKGSYDKPDSVVFLGKLPVTYEKKKGWVYFFKYKKARDDNFWQLGSVGMQPEKMDSIDIKNDDFYSDDDRKLKTDEAVDSQLQRMLTEMLNAKRMSASGFYDGRRYGLSNYYLSEMVKRERFNE